MLEDEKNCDYLYIKDKAQNGEDWRLRHNRNFAIRSQCELHEPGRKNTTGVDSHWDPLLAASDNIRPQLLSALFSKKSRLLFDTLCGVNIDSCYFIIYLTEHTAQAVTVWTCSVYSAKYVKYLCFYELVYETKEKFSVYHIICSVVHMRRFYSELTVRIFGTVPDQQISCA